MIRPMTSADVDRVLAIAAGLKEAPPWPRAVYEAVLEPATAGRRIALVASDAETGVIAGFAVASLVPPEGEVETVGVASEFQRRGIARQLVNEIAKNFRTRGVTKVWLEVRISNLAAKQLYGSLGFRETDRRPGYYVDPIEDAILMRLDLQGD
jgi:ribosomal-protein-alanine N-acetyltransferase